MPLPRIPICNSPSGGVQNVSPSPQVRMREKHPFIGTVCEEAVGSPSNRGGTMTTLMDTVRIEAPERSPVQPAAPLDCPRDTPSVSHSLERSYPVEFRGYPRTQWEQMAMSSGSPWPMSRGQPWPSHRPSSNAARPRIEPAGREPRVMSSLGTRCCDSQIRDVRCDAQVVSAAIAAGEQAGPALTICVNEL